MNNKNNILPINCRLINIVWIDRGIVITIIYYLLKYYKKIINKNIIIDNKLYRKFLRYFFPELKFKKYTIHKSNNFYFNIRKVFRNQDVFIDYISNYSKYIHTSKLRLVPWYDMNDPLISYVYNKERKLKIYKYKIFIETFSSCRRGNYNNLLWDIFIENNIFYKFKKHKPLTNMKDMYFVFRYYILLKYKFSYFIKKIEYPKIYYVKQPILIDNKNVLEAEYKDVIKNLEVKNEKNINNLINLLNEKIKLVNDIM